jgi:hypothetical protein
MSQPDKPDPVATAHGLMGSVNSLGNDVRALAAAVRRSRILIRITIIGMVVDVLATTAAIIAISVAAHANARADQANARAVANHAANVISCRGGNVIRGGEVQLWGKLYTASRKGHETAKQRRANAELIAYIRHLFRQKDCTAAYKVP